MGRREIEKLYKTIFLAIFVLSNYLTDALSVDYSKVHCQHKHPLAHEVFKTTGLEL